MFGTSSNDTSRLRYWSLCERLPMNDCIFKTASQ